jgi:hypothetical protein
LSKTWFLRSLGNISPETGPVGERKPIFSLSPTLALKTQRCANSDGDRMGVTVGACAAKSVVFSAEPREAERPMINAAHFI